MKSMHPYIWRALLAFACVLPAAPALAERGGGSASDRRIGQQAAEEIRESVHDTVYDHVWLQTEGGVVTLHGAVTSEYKEEELMEEVAEVEGVREVKSELKVLSPSTADERLREAIVERIYGDTLFSHLSPRIDAPIRVVVDTGHVTLAGVVGTQLQRRAAESFARGIPGVISVENHLLIDGEKEGS